MAIITQCMFSSNVWETIMLVDCITETVLKEMDQTHRQSEWWESQAKSPVWSTNSTVSSAPCKGNSFADGISPSLPHAATISKQRLAKAVLWRAKDFPLWRMLLSLTAKCTLWQRRGMIFPGVQTILSSHPHSHEFFRSGFGTGGFSVSHSMKQCIRILPMPFLKQTQEASLIYLFLESTPARGKHSRLHTSAVLWDFTITFY